MKTLIVFSTLVLFSIASHADDPANINQGNIRVGGSAGYGYSTISGNELSVNPLVEYFVQNHFALGLQIESLFSSPKGGGTTSSIVTLAPMITYYFWTQDKWAAYFEEQLAFTRVTGGSGSNDHSTITHTRIGANYFIIPQVAIGPVLSYDKEVDPGGTSDYDVTLTGTFSIFF